MATLDRHLSDTRRRLLRPSRASIDDGDLADYIIETIDSLVIDLNGSGEPWYLQTALIDTFPNDPIVPLTNVPNFGRARYLYTVDTANPDSERRRHVPLVPFETLTEVYGAGDRQGVGIIPASTPRYAAAASIYYLREAPGPGNVIEFSSVAPEVVQYKLVYEPDVVRPGAREDIGFRFAQFDGYVAALTALRALPHCTWRGSNEEKQEARRVQIATSCAVDIGSIGERRGYAWQFWCFQQSSTQTVQPTVTGWAENRW